MDSKIGAGDTLGSGSVGGLPDFELPDHEGSGWRLADHLPGGPLILIFYRGDW